MVAGMNKRSVNTEYMKKIIGVLPTILSLC